MYGKPPACEAAQFPSGYIRSTLRQQRSDGDGTSEARTGEKQLGSKQHADCRSTLRSYSQPVSTNALTLERATRAPTNAHARVQSHTGAGDVGT